MESHKYLNQEDVLISDDLTLVLLFKKTDPFFLTKCRFYYNLLSKEKKMFNSFNLYIKWDEIITEFKITHKFGGSYLKSTTSVKVKLTNGSEIEV